MQSHEVGPTKASVLVADDAPEMRSMLVEMLTRDGFDVTEATNGSDALRLLGLGPGVPPARAFDLIITDVRMPVVSGIDLLRVLRQLRLGTPVIVLTGFGSRDLHAETQKLGAALTLNKPVASLALRDAVRKLVDPPWW